MKKSNWILWLPIILSLLYQSYRYPLQINSSLTSPTYSDTPLGFQVGKFIMLTPFFAFATVLCLRKTLELKQWIVFFAVQFLFIFALIKTVSTGNPTYLETSFWIEGSLMLAWASRVISPKTIDKLFLFLLLYALGSNLIEVLLFILFGRLPALAYENSYSVRFGGFLDDPNGFAALLFLLMGWAYGRFTGKVRVGVLISLTLSLLITQSWTAIIFFALVIAFCMVLNFARRPIRVGGIFCICIVSIFFLARHIPDSALFLLQTMLQEKQGSADQHRFPLADFIQKWTQWFFQGSSKWDPYECWWGAALVNFGASWVLVAFGFVVFSLYSLRNSFANASVEDKPIYLGLLLFGTYFCLGSFNLPFPLIFPINILFFVFSFLIIFNKLEPNHSHQALHEDIFTAATAPK